MRVRYFEKLPGERIYLSPMNVEDVELYTKWLNDKEVTGFLGNFGMLFGLEAERKAVESMAAGGYNFAIVLRQGDRLIGNISLMEVDQRNRCATVGLFIGEAEHRSKGYGAEALRLLLDYGFNTLNLRNIDLTVHADNARGIACYKKVGFREYGRRGDAVFKDGRYVDQVRMEILDEEFNRGRG